MGSGLTDASALMERAGAAVAGQIRLRWPRAGRALILCGPGNNGGDGFVVARLLHRAGWKVDLRAMPAHHAPGRAPEAAAMRAACPVPAAALAPDALPGRPDVILDALFGTGLARPLDAGLGPLLARLRDWKQAGTGVVAVDGPSGLCLDSGRALGARELLAADLTVGFDSLRPGHLLAEGPGLCGKVLIADLGIAAHRPPAPPCLRMGPETLAALAGALAKGDQRHKYGHGHLLVVAGGPGRGGAARLAARAGLRVGAGLVTLAPPADAMAEHAGPPDALMRQPREGPADLEARLREGRIAALCLGPGSGVARAEALLAPLLESRLPCLLDADALTALAARADLRARLHPGCVLTPHGGEFARLFPQLAARLAEVPEAGPALSRLDAARQAAERTGAVLLLKGPDTVIAEPGGAALIHSARDLGWLATAGAGDVLSGLIAGLLARGLAPVQAAGAGVLLHGAAARRAGPGLIADDLPEALPAVLRDLCRAAPAP